MIRTTYIPWFNAKSNQASAAANTNQRDAAKPQQSLTVSCATALLPCNDPSLQALVVKSSDIPPESGHTPGDFCYFTGCIESNLARELEQPKTQNAPLKKLLQ
jgi:hypothetical protein